MIKATDQKQILNKCKEQLKRYIAFWFRTAYAYNEFFFKIVFLWQIFKRKYPTNPGLA